MKKIGCCLLIVMSFLVLLACDDDIKESTLIGAWVIDSSYNVTTGEEITHPQDSYYSFDGEKYWYGCPVCDMLYQDLSYIFDTNKMLITLSDNRTMKVLKLKFKELELEEYVDLYGNETVMRTKFHRRD